MNKYIPSYHKHNLTTMARRKDYNPVGKGEEAEEGEEERFEDEPEIRAHAVKVVPFDGISTKTNEEAGTGNVVCVVAPCNLPPHYRLLVRTPDGDYFDVLVPSNGVRQGQEFETTKIQPTPMEGTFGSGICDCCGEGTIGTWFWISWCCQGLSYGAIMEKLGLTWCANRPPSSRTKGTYLVVSGIWFFWIFSYFATNIYNIMHDPYQPNPGIMVFFFLLHFAASIYFLVICTKTRMAFRSKYKISGECVLFFERPRDYCFAEQHLMHKGLKLFGECCDCCADCLAVSFCACCSALQMYRHMKRSGDRPFRFESTWGEAEIV